MIVHRDAAIVSTIIIPSTPTTLSSVAFPIIGVPFAFALAASALFGLSVERRVVAAIARRLRGG